MPLPTPVTPETLRPYRFHGVRLDYREGVEQAEGDCPFCGREGKFSINVATGQAKCWICQTGTDKGGMNHTSFIRLLWDMLDKGMPDHVTLANERGLLYPETLMFWGVQWSPLSRAWLVPGYGIDGKLNQLYKYGKDKATGGMRLYPTPGLHHQIHGMGEWDPNKPYVDVCEGPWDGMAWWETLRISKLSDEGLAVTGNIASSLLSTTNVVAIPGCGSVGEPFKKWLPLFAGKHVRLLFDNDHPREHNGQQVDPAGITAVKRACALFSQADTPPATVEYLRWAETDEGTHDPDLKHGYDVRDRLKEGNKDVAERVRMLETLLARVRPVPSGWVPGRNGKAAPGKVTIDLLPCNQWTILVNAWKRAVKWTEGLEYGLAAILASVASVRMPGPQLWLQVISPPSTGKTMLCDAVANNRTFVKAIGNFTGLHSGWKTDADGEEDHSLMALIRDMTLMVKDADTVLRAKNRDAVLAELRDAYDTSSAVHFKNAISRAYTNHRFTVIFAGTEALLELDAAELGARFLNVIIMREIPVELETEINRRNFFNVFRNRGVEANGKQDSHDDPAMLTVKRLTAGYVQHLRENAANLLGGIDESNVEELCGKMDDLAQFVAFARARPSKKQDEVAVREMSSRLNAQLTKLAVCVAVVTNRTSVDDYVMRLVVRCALDTSRGRTLDIARILNTAEKDGMVLGTVSDLLGDLSEDKTRVLLKFLKRIGAVQSFKRAVVPGSSVKGPPRWRLTERFARLYREVITYGNSSSAVLPQPSPG